MVGTLHKGQDAIIDFKQTNKPENLYQNGSQIINFNLAGIMQWPITMHTKHVN